MTSLRFDGSGTEYFQIWIVNILLIIITLGLYYPWAKVRTKRYFYGSTSYENQPFEYHATGKQLFFSYLIAMVLLITYLVLQNLSPAISGVVFLVFLAALPWLIWKSLIFNMKMTSFANVRFQFNGSLGQSYLNYIGYPILLIAIASIVIALFNLVVGAIAGLLAMVFYVYGMAFLKKKNTEYRINGSRYGQSQFSTELALNPLVMISLKALGIFILALLVFFVFTGLTMGMAFFTQFQDMAADPEGIQENSEVFVQLILLIYLGFFVAGTFAFAFATARYRAYILQNTNLEDKAIFKSLVSARALTWVMVSNFLLIIVTLGLAIPWAKVRMARLMVDNTLIKAEVDLAEFTSQQQQKQSALGEQIGDAFDIDVGVGI